MQTTAQQQTGEGLVLSKGEYAARRGVHPSRVSQYIAQGKLAGAALVGHGRMARIDVAEADRQLAAALDPGQMIGQAVAGRTPAPEVVPTAQPQPSLQNNDVQRAAKARADRMEIETERARREAEAERGRYMEAGRARDAWQLQLGQIIAALQLWLPQLADRLAGELQVDKRQVLALLRQEWRAWRLDQQKVHEELAQGLVPLAEDSAAMKGEVEKHAA